MNRLTALLCLLTSGCVVFPYPHEAYLHSNVSGQVRDATTKEPIAGIKVHLAGETKTTDKDGTFTFTSSRERKWLVVVPLFPFDPLWQCSDRVEIDGYRDIDRERRYRSMNVEVNSCRYSAWTGLNDYLKNPSLVDNIGIVELKPKTTGAKP